MYGFQCLLLLYLLLSSVPSDSGIASRRNVSDFENASAALHGHEPCLCTSQPDTFQVNHSKTLTPLGVTIHVVPLK